MPGLLKVDETVQLEKLGSGGSSKLPSSNFTLWRPPAFVQVTFSPWLTVTLAGVNWFDEVAVTVCRPRRALA